MLGGLEAGAGIEIGATALWAVAPFFGVVMLATMLPMVRALEAL